MENTEFKNEFECIVELFGHTRMAGMVSEYQFAGSVFIRVDVPETKNQKGFTRMLNPSAIYALNPVDKLTMQTLAESLQVKPIEIWEISTIVNNRIKQLREGHKEDAEESQIPDDYYQ